VKERERGKEGEGRGVKGRRMRPIWDLTPPVDEGRKGQGGKLGLGRPGTFF